MQSTLRSELLQDAKNAVKDSFSRRDVHVVRAIALLEFLTEQHNGLVEQCRDWYSVHFPELHFLVEDHELFLKTVSRAGNRETLSVSTLTSLGFSSLLAQEVVNATKNTMGVTVGSEEMAAYQQLASNALSIYAEMKTLEKLLAFELAELCPNTMQLLGPITCAQLLARAGSLRQLAFRPAGTIQLLGAEKALFRHLRTNRKSRSPKHGILLHAGLVKAAPKNRKGAAARALASKVSLCARKDYYDPTLDGTFVQSCLDHVQAVIKAVPARKPTLPVKNPSSGFGGKKKKPFFRKKGGRR